MMGAWVEVSHDEKGIVWNKSIAPFDVHLLDLTTNNKQHSAKEIYKKLHGDGIDVLFDDRDVSAGEKFADADLIGIPVRLVVSKDTHSASSGQARDKVEWKERTSDKTELLSVSEVVKKLS